VKKSQESKRSHTLAPSTESVGLIASSDLIIADMFVYFGAFFRQTGLKNLFKVTLTGLNHTRNY